MFPMSKKVVQSTARMKKVRRAEPSQRTTNLARPSLLAVTNSLNFHCSRGLFQKRGRKRVRWPSWKIQFLRLPIRETHGLASPRPRSTRGPPKTGSLKHVPILKKPKRGIGWREGGVARPSCGCYVNVTGDG